MARNAMNYVKLDIWFSQRGIFNIQYIGVSQNGGTPQITQGMDDNLSIEIYGFGAHPFTHYI